uniref:Immune-type receptor 10 n=1 Tax=Sphoeroides nephelus TaxID=39110 RepID=Q9IB02_9TELE|nr:immune-type receptor 10 [Sphoeroides nephelus]
MASRFVLLVLLCEVVSLAVESSGVTQDPRFMTATVGETVTLRCFCGEDSVTFFSWYQQLLGGKPVIISSRLRHNTEATVYPQFQGRFEVESKEKVNHLTISDVLPSDSATYYCGILEFNSLEFGEGTLLQVRMPLSNVQAVVYQSALKPIELGDSVQLRCEVHSEKCEEKQSLYWLRYTSSQPGHIYPNEGTCVNEANITKCALTFSINSANSSDEGIYYCALASCGEVVLGNGTEVQLKRSKAQSLLLYCLSAALAVSIILLFALASTAYTLKNQICSVCKGTVVQSISLHSMSHDADEVHYAAVRLKRSSERDPNEEACQNEESVCVYSAIHVLQ